MKRTTAYSLLLIPLPPLALALCIALYGVDVPIWDEWFVLANMLDHLQNQGMGLQQLMAQHNEQRLLLTRTLELAGIFRGWSRLDFLWINFGLAAACFLSATLLYLPEQDTEKRAVPLWPLTVFSCLLFSVLQWETFSIGFNNQLLFPPLAVLLSAALLQKPGPVRFGGAALCCLAASFSFSAGLLTWLALVPCFLPCRRGDRRLMIWLALTAASWLTYFTGYTAPAHHAQGQSILNAPVEGASYFLTWLGSSLWAIRELPAGAAAVGLLGCLLAVVFAVQSVRRAGWSATRGWTCAILFALLCAAATATGRFHFGAEQAMESRYVSFSNLFWVGLAGLASLALPLAGNRARRAATLCATPLAAVFLLSSLLSVLVFHNRAEDFTQARNQLFSFSDMQRIERLFPDTNWLCARLPRFLQERVPPYNSIPDTRMLPVVTGHGSLERVGQDTPAENGLRFLHLRGHVPSDAQYILVESLGGRLLFAGQPDRDGRFDLRIHPAFLQGKDRVRVCVLRQGRLERLGDSLSWDGSHQPIPAGDVSAYFMEGR